MWEIRHGIYNLESWGNASGAVRAACAACDPWPVQVPVTSDDCLKARKPLLFQDIVRRC